QEHRITLHRGVSIEHVDRGRRTVRDSLGQEHAYDVLVMATGSRAAVLKDLPQMAGLFTMRNKRDADAFAAHVDPAKGKVVIIGGGLLGIELAAALQDIGVGSCILQRSSRLMDRQLDALGCQLLYEELVE